MAGAGGLANLASILGSSGISFKQVDDSDDEDDELHIIGDKGVPRQEGEMSEIGTKDEKSDEYIDSKALETDTKPSDITESLVSKKL